MSLNDRLNETSNLAKIVLFLSIVIVIGGGWYYFYYMDASKKIDNLQAQIDKLSAFKKELPVLRAKYKKAQQEFLVYKKELPLKEEIPSLLVKLTNIIKSKNVVLMSFKPKKAVEKKRFFIKPIDVSITSTYKNCGAVFEDVAKMDRLFKVKSFSLSNPKIVSSSKVLLDVKFSAETYYFKHSKR